MSVVPDYIEPLIGYRAWYVFDGRLASINNHQQWPEKQPMQAKCDNAESGGLHGMTGMMSSMVTSTVSMTTPVYATPAQAAVLAFGQWFNRCRHKAPMIGCSCGIYAHKHVNGSYMQSAPGSYHAWGEVYLWGKIQEYEDGYRAQFAYPKSLSTGAADVAQAIAAKYGVPCAAVRVKADRQTAQQKHIAALMALQAQTMLAKRAPSSGGWLGGLAGLLGGAGKGIVASTNTWSTNDPDDDDDDSTLGWKD